MARDLFAELGIPPPGQPQATQGRDLFAEHGIPPPEGFSEAALNRVKSYGVGARQIAGRQPTTEEMENFKRDRSGKAWWGQAAADLVTGLPVEMAATRLTHNPTLASGITSAIQAGMLPVGEDESRTARTATGFGIGLAGGKAAEMVRRGIAPVREAAAPYIQKAVKAAEDKFGFKLLPGQKTGDVKLLGQENKFEGKASTQPEMMKLRDENQAALNKAFAKQMGVQGDRITDDVIEDAQRRAGLQIQTPLQNKQIYFTPRYYQRIAAIEGNVSEAAEMLKGTKIGRILETVSPTGPSKFAATHPVTGVNFLDGKDYQTSRSLLLRMARQTENTNAPLSATFKQIAGALDDAAEESVVAYHRVSGNRMWQDAAKADIDSLKQGRAKWKAIIAAEDARDGSNIDVTAAQRVLDKMYQTGDKTEMRELLLALKDVPELAPRVGRPTVVREGAPGGAGAHGYVSPGGAGFSLNPKQLVAPITDPLSEALYFSKFGQGRNMPAGFGRKLLADALARGAGFAPREAQLDYLSEP